MPQLWPGNDYPLSERIRINVCGFLLRATIDVISSPVVLWPDRRRYKLWQPSAPLMPTERKRRTPRCRLVIYKPKVEKGGTFEPRGVVVHLHGGGWTISRPETEAPICRYLADKLGVVVVAPDYCKAPIYPYPYALEQQYHILTWIAKGGLTESLKRHRYTHPIDTTRIALSGGSSGSNLCAALTLLTITRPLPANASVATLGLLYPVLNLAVPHGEKMKKVDPYRGLPPALSRFFINAYLPPPRSVEDPFVSPALAGEAELKLFPPTVILTAQYDYLAKEAEEFVESLRAQGISVTHHRFPDVGHAFDGIPTFDKKQRMLNNKARDEAWGMIVSQFKEVLL